MLKRFNVEYLSPCVGVQELSLLGQRASRPLEELGQRASCPLTWTAPEVKEFPLAQASISSHFSHTLAAGCSHSRNLPHIGQSSTLVFVTFRLADSLPKSKLNELAALREEWLRKHPVPWDEAACSEWESASFQKIEEWLDAGHGSCILADPALRKVVEDAMEHFNDTGTTGVPPVEKETGTTGVSPVEKDWDNGRPARCEGDSHLYSNGQDATPARASASRTYPPSEASRASGGYRGASGWGICCPSDLRGDLLKLFAGAPDQDDLCALSGEILGYRRAERSARAGDYSNFAFTVVHVSFPHVCFFTCKIFRFAEEATLLVSSPRPQRLKMRPAQQGETPQLSVFAHFNSSLRSLRSLWLKIPFAFL